MNIAVFSAKPYDRTFLTDANRPPHTLRFFDVRLGEQTAPLTRGFDAVCVFVNDELPASVLKTLRSEGVQLIALRCAGYNNVDVKAAQALGMPVVRVPAYSPHAVAEHALALMLALNRKIHRAYNRVREGNFALDGLMGFDFFGRTVGVVGVGKIGIQIIRIARALGCQVLAFDPYPSPQAEALGARYVPLTQLLSASDVISLHCPLTKENYHLINEQTIAQMKPGVMIINTGRGALIDAAAMIEGLKSGQIGSVGLDVYEEEADLFFEDRSSGVIQDDIFARLLTFPNVLITGHQAFFTSDALRNIAETTIANIDAIASGRPCLNEVR